MAKRPNIFIYMMDTARSDSMSCYNYHRPTTPHMARIAADGAIFENHYVNSCWSLPSQTSFMTGKHVCGHACGDNYQFLEPGIPTLAETLNRAGYYTAAIQINPWVQQDEGNCMRGFTEFTRPRMAPRKSSTGRKITGAGPGVDIPLREPYVPIEGEADTGICWAMAGWVEDWLDKHAMQEPWCLFVLSMEPHMPLWPPKKYREQFLPPGYPDEKAQAIPQNQFLGTAGVETCTTAEWGIVRDLRDGSMAYIDRCIGEIYDNFKKRGLLEDTVFAVTSDHGDSHGEHGFHTAHCQIELWDTLLHTPLIMTYPKRIPAGTRVKHLAQGIDVMPTFLELAGIDDAEAKRHMQGKSLLKAIDGEPVHEFVMSELEKPLEPMHLTAKLAPGFDYRVYNYTKKSAHTLEWKYIWCSNGQDKLFNTAKDPDEHRNLICEHPEIAEELRLKMENYLLTLEKRDFGDRLKHTGHVVVDLEVQKRLAAWGIYRETIGQPVKQENESRADGGAIR